MHWFHLQDSPPASRISPARAQSSTARRLAIGAAVLLTACQAQQSPNATVEATEAPSQIATAPPEAPSQIAAAPPEAVGDSSSPPRLTAEGWGDLRIGMTRAEVVAAAGEDANPGAVGGPDPAACDVFRPAEAPEGMLVMIERDTLTRISISSPADVETDRGISIGDPADKVKEIYGSRAIVTPHKYVASPAEYVMVWTVEDAGAESRGVVHEVGADGRVMHIHAGGPSIQYVEGCL